MWTGLTSVSMVSMTIKKQINFETWLNVSSLYFCSLKKKLLSDNKNKARYSRGCLRNGGYCSNCVPFLSQLCASIFHESPSSCLYHVGEQGGKCHRKIARKVLGGETKTQGKNKRVEQGSDYEEEEKEKKLCIQLFSIFTWKEKSQMKSAFRRRQTFFGWANTDSHISTVETRHRQTHRKMDSLRPQSHI